MRGISQTAEGAEAGSLHFSVEVDPHLACGFSARDACMGPCTRVHHCCAMEIIGIRVIARTENERIISAEAKPKVIGGTRDFGVEQHTRVSLVLTRSVRTCFEPCTHREVIFYRPIHDKRIVVGCGECITLRITETETGNIGRECGRAICRHAPMESIAACVRGNRVAAVQCIERKIGLWRTEMCR